MSNTGQIEELPPCEGCEFRSSCSLLSKSCSAMTKFIHTGSYRGEARQPTHRSYDSTFNQDKGHTLMNREEFMRSLKCKDRHKSKLANTLLRNLHNAAVEPEDHIPLDREDMFSQWDWIIAVSNDRISPVVLSAIGYEHSGDGIYVSFLYTRQYYQGRGLGGELLDKLEELSPSRIALYPEPNSRAFYKRRGFKKTITSKSLLVKEYERIRPRDT